MLPLWLTARDRGGGRPAHRPGLFVACVGRWSGVSGGPDHAGFAGLIDPVRFFMAVRGCPWLSVALGWAIPAPWCPDRCPTVPRVAGVREAAANCFLSPPWLQASGMPALLHPEEISPALPLARLRPRRVARGRLSHRRLPVQRWKGRLRSYRPPSWEASSARPSASGNVPSWQAASIWFLFAAGEAPEVLISIAGYKVLGWENGQAPAVDTDRGRFWTMDTWEDPIHPNLYWYGNSSPINMRDRSGHMSAAEFVVVVAIIVIVVYSLSGCGSNSKEEAKKVPSGASINDVFIFRGPYSQKYRDTLLEFETKGEPGSKLISVMTQLKNYGHKTGIKIYIVDFSGDNTTPVTAAYYSWNRAYVNEPVDYDLEMQMGGANSYTVGNRTWTFKAAFAHELLHAYHDTLGQDTSSHSSSYSDWLVEEENITREADLPGGRQ